MQRLLIGSLVVCWLCARPVSAQDPDATQNWPQWRGPLATGAAPGADPPLQWSEDKNIRWKIELPGVGHSTPIAWGERIFVTAAIPDGDALVPRYSGAPGASSSLCGLGHQPPRRHGPLGA